MIKMKFVAVVGLLFVNHLIYAQAKGSPYILKSSEQFESPKGYDYYQRYEFGKDEIFQFSYKDANLFAVHKFSKDLKLLKEGMINNKARLPENSELQAFYQLNKKAYLFTEAEETVSALEFFPEKLDFSEKSIVLFKPSDKTRDGFQLVKSSDHSKFMFTYSLKPIDKRNVTNKEIFGFQIFDSDLKKVWSAEYEMPYTEAKMVIYNYKLSNDGKVYLLAKVFRTDGRKEIVDGQINFDFQVFAFQKDVKELKMIALGEEGKFPISGSFLEDVNKNIIAVGSFAKGTHGYIEGYYSIKLDVKSAALTKINGGYFELPTDIIKEYTKPGEQKKLEEKEADGKNIGLINPEVKDIYTMPDGSVKIIVEEYKVSYMKHDEVGTSEASDVYIFSIGANGNKEWIRKIPKFQTGTAMAPQNSVNTLTVGNDLHIFFLDNIKNDDILKTKLPPERYKADDEGSLIGNVIDSKGTITRYNLGDIGIYKTNFYVRRFNEGKSNNLIGTARKKGNSTLFTLQVK